jgi:hypothetical protein
VNTNTLVDAKEMYMSDKNSLQMIKVGAYKRNGTFEAK